VPVLIIDARALHVDLMGIVGGKAASWPLTRTSVVFALLVCWPIMANAQMKEVWGVVTDSAGQPVAGAAVKLANKVNLTIRSFITQANGEYRFNGLHPDIEYTLRAQKGGIFTKPKTLSYFKSSESVRVDIQFEKGSKAT